MAHPDLVPVCREVFDAVLGDRPNQLDRQRPEVSVTAGPAAGHRLRRAAQVTEAGLRLNLYVAVAYTAVWLSGNGAVAIHNLMEDAATAEISRSQVWQQIRNEVGAGRHRRHRHPRAGRRGSWPRKPRSSAARWARRPSRSYYLPASKLIADICLSEDYTDFLTTPAYELVG